MTRTEQITAFIRASLADGTTREALEYAMVCMCLAKNHAQARRAITIAEQPLKPRSRWTAYIIALAKCNPTPVKFKKL